MATEMQNYKLFLHYYKQGNAFAVHLKQARSVSDAFRDWARVFKAHHDVCLRVADALEGKCLHADGSGHWISLRGEDEEAAAAIAALEGEGLLYTFDDEEDEDRSQGSL